MAKIQIISEKRTPFDENFSVIEQFTALSITAEMLVNDQTHRI